MNYNEFLFQTLYMLINKPIQEYDIVFDKIAKLYERYLVSDVAMDYSKSDYEAMSSFLEENKEQ